MRPPSRKWDPRLWASWKPFGIGEQRPNNYLEILRALWENRDRLGYAWRILRDGVCDGCALGTTGMRDWTITGIHLCNIRLRLLRLNTMPPFDPALLQDVRPLSGRSGRALRALGRLPCPFIRFRGEAGFRRISWEEALDFIAERIRQSAPHRLAFYLTSRGLPNEAYYVAQKAVRAMGTNNIDNAARVCHTPSTLALKAALGVAATTCSYSDLIGTDLIAFLGSNVANNQPVMMKYLYYARKAGTRVALINPPEMIDAARRGELDLLFSVGGNFHEVLPDPAGVREALERVPLRVHMDIVLSPPMLFEPGEAVVLLPAATRYEGPGGVTETTTERRVIFSPEIPGPRVPEARPEWWVFGELAARVRPDLASQVRFPDTATIREEIARVIPMYDGIQHLRKKGDAFQGLARMGAAGGTADATDGLDRR